MKTENEMKSQIIKIGVLVVAIVVIGISLSYAFFTGVLSGESEIDTRNAAKLDLTSTLTDADAINNMHLELIDQEKIKTAAEKVEFSITNQNTSTVSGKYFIYLTDINMSRNLYSKYFKWELARVTSTGESVINSGNFLAATRVGAPTDGEANNVITTVEDISLNKVALQIPVNTTDNLVFRLWLENDPDANQIDLTDGSFEGRLKIEATPVK